LTALAQLWGSSDCPSPRSQTELSLQILQRAAGAAGRLPPIDDVVSPVALLEVIEMLGQRLRTTPRTRHNASRPNPHTVIAAVRDIQEVA